MKFIHLTDTHLRPPGKTLCALDPAARLRAAIERIGAMDSDADFAVMTGDLSYHGGEPAYRDLRQMLDGLPMPCHLLIGNHDDRETFKQVFPETGVDTNGFVQYAVETKAGV
ncbi:MAG: metallophosphoesterase, partial [Pseudomonadota bacterium]